MKVSLEEAELELLVLQVSNRIIEALKLSKKDDDDYVNPAEAMLLLGCKSHTTLKSYFDKGLIERFEYKGAIRYTKSSIRNFQKKYTSNYGH